MVKVRANIWIVLFIGIVLNSFHILNMNVAILSMVKHHDGTTYQQNDTSNNRNSQAICGYYNEKVDSRSAIEIQTRSNGKSIEQNDNLLLDWTKADQNLVLGSGSWLIWIGHFFAGLLMHRFGVNIVVTLSTILCAVLSFLTPPSAFIGPVLVAFITGIKGFLTTVAFPVGAVMLIGKWSPLEERGKFMSVFIAVPLSASLSFVLFPYISEYIGWPYAFHVAGVCSLLWCLSWWYYVYDTPEQHPRIKDKEKNYIKYSLAEDSSSSEHRVISVVSSLILTGKDLPPEAENLRNKKAIFEETKKFRNTKTYPAILIRIVMRLPIPWKQILTSVPFYIVVSNHFTFMWVTVVIMVYGPTYFYDWFGFSTEKSGIIISISYLLNAVFTYFGGIATDNIIQRKTLSVTNVRKMWTALGALIPALSLLLLAFCSCNVTLAVIGVITNISLSSFFTVGMSTSVIDLSPNFCSILQAICGSVSFSACFIVAIFIQFVSEIYDTYTQWQIIYVFSTIVQTVPAVIFLFFGESEIQPWNNPLCTTDDITTNRKSMIRSEERRYYKSIQIVGNNDDDDDDVNNKIGK